MSKDQAIFVTSDFLCHDSQENDSDTVITCYARENSSFRRISSGSMDSVPAECLTAVDELIQDIGEPAFEMWEVPVYVDSDTSLTDLEIWYIRQIIAASLRDIAVPIHMERLYRAGRSFLYITCEADEGWNFALYAADDEGILRLKDGGYIEGRIADPIDMIAVTAAKRLLLTDSPEEAEITTGQLFDWVIEKADMEYRGVKVFLSPELKADGIDAVPSGTLDELKKTVNDRLSKPLLMTYDPVNGYRMNFIRTAEIRDNARKEVRLPDGTIGILCFDPSVTDETISEYDDEWARELWLQDIRIRIRGGKHVLESE